MRVSHGVRWTSPADIIITPQMRAEAAKALSAWQRGYERIHDVTLGEPIETVQPPDHENGMGVGLRWEWEADDGGA